MGSQGGSQPQQDQRSLPPLLPHGRSFFIHLISMKWQYVKFNLYASTKVITMTLDTERLKKSDKRLATRTDGALRGTSFTAGSPTTRPQDVSSMTTGWASSFGSLNIELTCCRLILQNKNHCGTLWSFGFVMSIQQYCSALPCPLFLFSRFEDV